MKTIEMPSATGCGECRHVKVLGVNKETLTRHVECRRYPPTVTIFPTPAGPQPVSFFPPTQEQFTCGEWAPASMQ